MGLATIVFWKYQKNKKGESPIFIRIIEDRKSRYIKTGLMATEEDWDFNENLFKTKYRKSEDFLKAESHRQNNELLKKKLADTETLIKDLMINDNLISSEQVKQEIVKAKNASKQSLFAYIDTIVDEKSKMGTIGTAKCYSDLKNSLKTFIGKDGKSDLTFKDVTVAFLKKYETDFKLRGTTDNGISFYMRTLRAVLNKAISEGACKKDIYPFDAYKISNLSTKTIKRAINKADIELIRHYECESDSQLFRSKNIFLFSFYNRGINFSDIAMLKWENIRENRLTYTRLKTGKYYNILLLDPALDILLYYRSNFYRGENSYIFPILDDQRHLTPISIQNRLHKVLGQTNKDLKLIGEQLGIKTPLTTYVARHSYATVLKRSGVSTSIISEAMGHDSERTTQIYLDNFENDVLDEASMALL
jgi:integrase